MEIKKIYFDLDGVLADFEKGVINLAHFNKLNQNDTSKEQDSKMWENISKVPNFYDKLEVMKGAKEMFDYVYEKYGNKCEILTGIPKPHRNIPTSGEDKIKWVKRMLSTDINVNIVYKEEKKNFCKGEDYILIDDLDKNIIDWLTFGGTAILHKSPKETLRIIKEIENL